MGMLNDAEPFAGLFTQGMVTHETYRRQTDGQWVEPTDVEIEPRASASAAPAVDRRAPGHRRHREDVEVEEERRRARGDLRRLRRRRRAPVRAVRQPARARRAVDPSGVEGAWRFVHRVWAEFDARPAGDRRARTMAANAALRRETHKLIKAVTEAIEGFRFNSGIAKLYEFLNLLKANPADATPAGWRARAEALSALPV
jgi:leucyl-tRNA synthetase